MVTENKAKLTCTCSIFICVISASLSSKYVELIKWMVGGCVYQMNYYCYWYIAHFLVTVSIFCYNFYDGVFFSASFIVYLLFENLFVFVTHTLILPCDEFLLLFVMFSRNNEIKQQKKPECCCSLDLVMRTKFPTESIQMRNRAAITTKKNQCNYETEINAKWVTNFRFFFIRMSKLTVRYYDYYCQLCSWCLFSLLKP